MSSYKLTYFNGRGRAELSRLIFAAAGVQFTDERVTNWPTGKEDSPLGQLPYLTIDGIKLPQSLSIGRYLAKQFNLAGVDNLTQAKADAIVDTLNDVLDPFYGKVAFAKENKEEAVKTFMEKTAIPVLEKTEKLVKMYGQNGFSAGNSLTWADLFLYEVTSNILSADQKALNPFPSVQKVRNLVEANPKVGEYLKTRPKTGF